MAFRSNASLLASKQLRRASAIVREQRRMAVIIAREISKEAHVQQERLIYSVPIPRSPSGRPLWIRKHTKRGGLRAGERAKTIGQLGLSVVLLNDAPHAARRHYQKVFVHMRPAPWRTIAIKNKRRWVLEKRREAQIRALRRT